MGRLGAVLGLLKAAPKVGDMGQSIINQSSTAIDKLIYTNQEQIQDRVKAGQDAYNLFLDFMKLQSTESTDRAKARRELASLIMKVYLFGVLASIATAWDPSLSNLIADRVQILNYMAMMVATFFFGGYAVGVYGNMLRGEKKSKEEKPEKVE